MNWKLIKAFPKIVLVAAVFLISTGLFGFWWMTRRPAMPVVQSPAPIKPAEVVSNTKEEKQKKAATLPAKMGWLALVGTDLWDISTGEIIFPSWLNETAPNRLFYQPGTNRLMAEYERMTVRYGLDGVRDAQLFPGSPPAFSSDGKQAMYVLDGDITIADVDRQGFRFSNERQVTKLGQFYAPFFAAGIALRSEKRLIVRNQNKYLFVDLKTGDVKPIQQFAGYKPKMRSPDKSVLLGADTKGITALDIDVGASKHFSTGGGAATDVLWLNNHRCALLVGLDSIMVYDRKTESLGQVAKLPFRCSRLVGPSPTGRYFMAMDSSRAVVVDVEQKRTIEFGRVPQNADWISDDTLICSMDAPDTSVRGTWLKTIGKGETRVVAAPYFFGNLQKGAETVMPETGLVLFASQTTLYRMQKDGSDLKELGKLMRPVQRIQAVEIWGR